MRKTRPWDLDEHWLEPGKVITDPIHGDLHLTVLEMAIIDSAPFQRLRKVRQLGSTHLVYPGATHTRFAHSLGAVKVAQDLVDAVLDQRSGRHPVPDLFGQWEAELGTRSADGTYTLDGDRTRQFDRRVAEITVLARLGALLHDFCHVPFGHSIEDDLGILDAHDENGPRLDRLWAEVPRDIREAMAADGRLKPELRRLILSKAKGQPASEYPFVADIVGNTICADLLDYLRRDHLYTGLPLALGRRFEAGYYVLPDGDPDYGRRMVLSVHRKGEERPDAITEILKHLRYRYELSERALVHHTKLAADAMVGKALEIWHDALWAESASDALAGEDGPLWPEGTDLEVLREKVTEIGVDPKELDTSVQQELDVVMTRKGDDGLLEYLADLPGAGPLGRHRDKSRRAAAADLGAQVERRQLFKPIAVQSDTSIERDDFYKKFGDPDRRRELEQQAARFADITPAWWVLIWIPDPRMRLKVAGVYVDDGEKIRRFVDREAKDKDRGAEIYDAHKDLWAVSVFVHPEVRDDAEKRRLVLASLAADLNVDLGNVAKEMEAPPHELPDRIALEKLGKEIDKVFSEVDIEDLLAARRRTLSARGDDPEVRPSLSALVAAYHQLIES